MLLIIEPRSLWELLIKRYVILVSKYHLWFSLFIVLMVVVQNAQGAKRFSVIAHTWSRLCLTVTTSTFARQISSLRRSKNRLKLLDDGLKKNRKIMGLRNNRVYERYGYRTGLTVKYLNLQWLEIKFGFYMVFSCSYDRKWIQKLGIVSQKDKHT